MQKRLGASVVVIVAVLFAGKACGSVALAPGCTAYDSELGTSPAYSTILPGFFTSENLVGHLVSQYIIGSQDMTGQVTTNVYQDPSNSDELTFEYQFTSTGSSELNRATVDDLSNPWLGYSILDVGADGSGSSSPAGRSPEWNNGDPNFILADTGYPGSAGMDFQFMASDKGTTLRGPSGSSAEIWVTTNALSYQMSGVGLSDGGATSSAEAYAPASTPEPISLLFFGTGLAAVGGYVTRRRNR